MSRGQLEFIKERGIEPKVMVDAGPGTPYSEAWEAERLWNIQPDIYGFEPCDIRFRLLRDARYPGTLKPWGLGAANGLITLWPAGPNFNSSAFRLNEVGQINYATPVVRLDDFMRWDANCCDNILLWLDIEASERDALLGATETLKRTIAVVVEVRDEVPCDGWCTATEVAEILTGAGFTKAAEVVKEGNRAS